MLRPSIPTLNSGQSRYFCNLLKSSEDDFTFSTRAYSEVNPQIFNGTCLGTKPQNKFEFPSLSQSEVDTLASSRCFGPQANHGDTIVDGSYYPKYAKSNQQVYSLI